MPELLFEKGCRFMNRYLSWVFKAINLEWDPDLEEAIEFTKLDVKPLEVVTFAWATALLSIVFFSILSLLIFFLGYLALARFYYGDFPCLLYLHLSEEVGQL